MLVDERLARLPASGASVLELGGKKDGHHAVLFRAKGCAYLSAGFEGDLPADLNGGPVPAADASHDLVLISMVLMYLDFGSAIAGTLRESLRVLKPGGRILIFEPFLYPETPHRGVPDISRLGLSGIEGSLRKAGFESIRGERLGGVFACAASPVADLLPGALWPLKSAMLRIAAFADSSLGRSSYVRRRSERYYQGYFVEARKGGGRG